MRIAALLTSGAGERQSRCAVKLTCRAMRNERLFAAARGASGWPRLPTVAAEAMVATSHTLATRAGLRALEAGGNAVDAALAAAAMLTVCEPPHNGVGGDAFALLWWDGALHGLNGSGRSPAVLDAPSVDDGGPRSVTVPGAVRAWADLAERFGRRGLDAALADAIDAAREGIAATARIAEHWRRAERAPWPAPRLGERYTLPGLGGTLRAIADRGPAALYEGPVAEAIAASCWLSTEDLAAHRSEWVQPLRRAYRGVEVCELPPNSQGVTALVALGIAEELDGSLHEDIEAAKLALDWAAREVGDAPVELPDLDALRARIRPDAAVDARVWPGDGTTFLCVVDGDRNAIALIQSLYEGFGSGVVAGDTGVALHSRGACFRSEEGHANCLGPGRRPFHTLMPGMLLRDGGLLGPFGVMGAAMQAQGHMQLVRRVVDDGLDPQAALDAARFRATGGRRVLLEPGLAGEVDDLRARGHEAEVSEVPHPFGVGQMILTEGDALTAGSDGRADGHAAGL
jgi:gamma-glutamyltranspeptidase / glutathione hydrolase